MHRHFTLLKEGSIETQTSPEGKHKNSIFKELRVLTISDEKALKCCRLLIDHRLPLKSWEKFVCYKTKLTIWWFGETLRNLSLHRFRDKRPRQPKEPEILHLHQTNKPGFSRIFKHITPYLYYSRCWTFHLRLQKMAFRYTVESLAGWNLPFREHSAFCFFVFFWKNKVFWFTFSCFKAENLTNVAEF